MENNNQNQNQNRHQFNDASKKGFLKKINVKSPKFWIATVGSTAIVTGIVLLTKKVIVPKVKAWKEKRAEGAEKK